MSAPDRTVPPAPGPLRPYHFPPVSRFVLSNGLPVVVARTDGLPVVTLSVLLRAGGVQEDASRAGLASLTSALLESGAGSKSVAEIAEEVEMLGLDLGASAGWDVAQVEATGLRGHWRAATGVVAELLRRPTFPEGEVERLRAEHIAAILQRRADPRGLANEMASRFVFSADSPFSRPLSGSEATLSGLTRSDVLDFHAAHYSPTGAAVVVAGEIEPSEVEASLSEVLADWAGPSAVASRPSAEPRLSRREVFLVDRPGSVQSEIRVGQVGLPRATPDYFPVQVMNAILGGAFTSRLNLNLREERGFTYGVSSSFIMRREPGPFLVSTAVQTEVTAAALTEIFRELDALRTVAPKAAEVDDARNYLAGVFPLRLQTTDGVAGRLAELVMYDLPEDYFDIYRDRILAVGVDDVHRVARAHLQPERMAVVIVGDAEKIRGAVEELGLGPVHAVQPADLP
ncbi:MAG TPA: pitrilysin family protein [Longimicrobiaceae bacterium]|nr:pitrilysin family protein [Longimicrobiaceae bacterium]